MLGKRVAAIALLFNNTVDMTLSRITSYPICLDVSDQPEETLKILTDRYVYCSQIRYKIVHFMVLES